MSLTIEPLQSVNVVEDRCKFNEKRRYAIVKGGMINSFKPVNSTSFSTSSIQFTAPPPNPAILVDRKVMLRVPLRVVYRGDSGADDVPLVQIGRYDALRQAPLSSIINVLASTINNTTCSINMNDVVHSFLRFNSSPHARNCMLGASPMRPDTTQTYADADGANINSLKDYRDSDMGADLGRGAFPYVQTVPAGATERTGAQLDWIVAEPIFMSPYLFGSHQHTAFLGVQTLDFNITLDSNLARCVSHMVGGSSPVNAFDSVTVTIPTAPSLLFEYITPQQLVPIPRFVQYPYAVVDRYPTNVGLIADNDAHTQSSNNIQLNSIPQSIYVFLRRSNDTRTLYTADTYAIIDSLRVNFNNQAGLLSSATPQDKFKSYKVNLIRSY